MERALAFFRRRPTEVVFAMIISGFIGPRLVNILHSALFEQEGDFNDFARDGAEKVHVVEERFPANRDIVYISGIGDMHIDQVKSGQDLLYKEFGIDFAHFADPESYYKRVKQELVLGFRGMEGDDSKHMYTALQTIFLITNIFTWNILISVLISWFPAFAKWRSDPLESVSTIFTASILDICLTILPILLMWALYEYSITIHVVSLGFIVVLALVHKATGRDKTDPIFSDWLIPGGSNPHTELYSFKPVEIATLECLCCTEEGRSKLAE